MMTNGAAVCEICGERPFETTVPAKENQKELKVCYGCIAVWLKKQTEPSLGLEVTEVDAHCSFCGRANKEVKKLIAGPNAFICDQCVALCQDIVDEDSGQVASVRVRSAGENSFMFVGNNHGDVIIINTEQAFSGRAEDLRRFLQDELAG